MFAEHLSVSVNWNLSKAWHITVKYNPPRQCAPIDINGGQWADAKTGQGSISVTLGVQPTDDMTLSTALGSITLDMPEGTNADVTASTAMGSISIDGLKADRSKHTGQHRRMQTILGDGGVAISCTTHQGSITIDG